jgi:DNA-directed RNA polymerase specialized sigma24 family protein
MRDSAAMVENRILRPSTCLPTSGQGTLQKHTVRFGHPHNCPIEAIMLDTPSRLSLSLQSQHRAAIDDFEAAWQRGEFPQIADFLPAADGSDSGKAARRQVLLELVILDLWYRWRLASSKADARGPGQQPPKSAPPFTPRPLLDDYLQAYAELGPMSDLPIEAVVEEYRACLYWGPGASMSEYLARFPAHAKELPDRLNAVEPAAKPASTPAQAAPIARSGKPGSVRPGTDKMTEEGQPSISQWIIGAKEGRSQAINALWGRYFQQLVRLARQRLGALPRRAADEEDLALSAFASFCHAAEEGKFPDLADRDDLWRLLITITAQKAIDQARHDGRAKRGAGLVRGESALDHLDPQHGGRGLEHVVGDSPTPEFAAIMAEECSRLLGGLDGDLRRIAVAKMEECTNEEIAERLDCSVSTVERSLRLIRKIWQREMAD